jgi:OOP family OmpA-OmpF porin
MATANLLDASKSFMTPDVLNKLSMALGQSSDKVQTGLKSVVPAFIMGLANKGATTEGAESLVNLVQQKGFDSEVPPPNINDENYIRRGEDAVNGVFGNNLNKVVSGLSTSTGMNTYSIRKLLGIIAPTILGVLGSKIKREGMSTSGVQGFLNQQKSTAAGFIPTSLSAMFGGGVKTSATGVRTTKYTIDDSIRRPKVAQSTATSSRSDSRINYRRSDYGYVGGDRKSKVWGILGLLAVVALVAVMWMYSKNRAINIPNVSVPKAIERDVNKVETGGKNLTNNIREALTPAAENLNQLSAFITSGATIDLPKRFRFDYLFFDTGTTNLSADATNEINTIAGALKANPAAKARIEGFTDSSGEPQANIELTTERAAAVKDLLVSRGIAAERIEVVGRGSNAPIASNTSEAGKLQNRRIEFIVTSLK